MCFGTNSADRRAKLEYSFGKLLNSARVLSAKCFGVEVKMNKNIYKIRIVTVYNKQIREKDNKYVYTMCLL